jgi:hypothetical protein
MPKAQSWYYNYEHGSGQLYFSEPENEQYVKDYWCLLYGYPEPPAGLRVWPRVMWEEGDAFPYAKSRAL